MRLNTTPMADRAAEIVAEHPNDSWALWCFTNYEADAIKEAIPSAVDLRGNESISTKKAKLEGFVSGEIKHLITKPDIAGMGLNWQHCHRTLFSMGTNHSFEKFHQAIHRHHRFGQQHQVSAHLIYPETAGSVRQTIERKQLQHEQMQAELTKAVRKAQLAIHQNKRYDDYNPTIEMEVPQWLHSKH